MKNSNYEIIVIGPRSLESNPGGIEIHCKKLYKHFDCASANLNILMLICSNDPKEYKNVIQLENYSTMSIKGSSIKYFDKLFYSFRSLFYILKIKPRLVHMQGFSVSWIAPFLRLYKIPILTTIHSREYNNPGKIFIIRFIAKIAKDLAKKFSNIIVISRSAKKDFNSSVLIPNGEDAPFITQSDRNRRDEKLQDLGIDQDYFLCLGRVVTEKGIDLLVQELSIGGIHNPLIIIGPIDQKHYKYLLNLNISKNYQNLIYFLGPLDHSLCMAFMENAKLYLSASKLEECPIAPREALALDVPMLLSDIEAHRDIELDDMSYYKFGTFSGMQKKVQKILAEHSNVNKPDREIYLWEDCAKDTFDLYKKIFANDNG